MLLTNCVLTKQFHGSLTTYKLKKKKHTKKWKTIRKILFEYKYSKKSLHIK